MTNTREERFDTVILGAGAAGMHCAAFAAGRGGRVLAIDHAAAPGEKIRISGGGRCNFTNLETRPERFLSANPHFAKSALARYGPWDFIDLLVRHGVPYHEKTLGQLFCDRSSRDVIEVLRLEMERAGAELRLRTTVEEVAARDGGFELRLATEGVESRVACRALVVATGGKSIPKMGATGLAYRLAEQFGLAVTETRPALVPFTFGGAALERLKALSGVAVEGRVATRRAAFDEAVLFTHRGLSGPAVLQASSYWREGEDIVLSLLPGFDWLAALKAERAEGGARGVAAVLAAWLPKRLAQSLCEEAGVTGRLAEQSDAQLAILGERLQAWRLTPTGTEGYRTAEVTLGGVDTAGLDSRTMAAKAAPGLYFIGEAVDVTGWLGGYNFQWAWSSAWAAGTAIAEHAG